MIGTHPDRFEQRSARARMALAGLALLASLTWVGCSGGVAPPAVPRPDASIQLDPHVAELIERSAQEVESEPVNPGTWLVLAMVYQANDLFEPARICYEHAVAVDDAQPRWWYQLAKVRHRLGDLDGALVAVTRTIDLDQQYGPAFWRRGQWYLALGQVETAEADFQRAVELNGEDPEALLGLGRVRLEQERPDETVALMERLLGLDPRDPQAHQQMATALRQLGRMDEAAEHLALGDGQHYVRTDEWATDILRFQVGYSDRLRLAQRFESDGQWDAAIRIYEELRQRTPDDVRVLAQLGRVYLLVDRRDEAKTVLVRAVELGPDDDRARFEMAGYYHLAGLPDSALAEVDRAIELKPAWARAHQRRGLILKAADRCAEAVPSFLRALELSPGDPSILIPFGDCQGSLGRWADAGRAYQMALKRDSTDADLHVRLGLSLLRVGRLPEAEATLSRALTLGPKRPREVGRLLDRVRRELGGAAGDAS